MEKPKVVEALEHAWDRLNSIEHNYEDTDFKLIEEALRQQYYLHDIPNDKRKMKTY